MNELEQEIRWLKEDIAEDEALTNPTDFSRQRLEYSKARLEELLNEER